MRKVLSFVLVLAMILGSVSMAFAFSDTEGKTYENAATVLNELDVISGYADGTFGGGKSITRAEFATMVVNALGFTTKGSAATGFKDVPNDYWAAQAILTAKNLGIIYGKTATAFAPKDNITCDEAIAMLIRGLGYKAEYLQGSFPTSYVNQAMTLDILDDVNVGSAAATRGDVAQLIYNALGCGFVSYNKSAGTLVEGSKLIERLGAAVITNQAITRSIALKGDDLLGYVGSHGNVYANKAVNYTKVYAIAPDSTLISGKYDSAKKTVTDADGTVFYLNTTTANAVYTNGVSNLTPTQITGSSVTLTVDVTNEVVDEIYAQIKWDATTNGAEDQATSATVDEINIKHKLLGKAFKETSKKAIDEAYFELFGVDSLSEIKADDVVTVYTDGTYITRVEVSDETVVGKVSETEITSGTKYFFIDGGKYTLSSGVTAPVAGSEGTFYLNYAGKIAAFEASVTKEKYAAIVAFDNAAPTGIDKGKAKVQLFTAEGEKLVYNVNKNATWDTENGLTTGQALYSAGVLADGGVAIAKNNVICYKLNGDNEIIYVKPIVTSTTTTFGAIDKNSTHLGQKINTSTIVFNYDATDGWSLGDGSKLANSNGIFAGIASKNVYKVLVQMNVVAEDTKYYVINKVNTYSETSGVYNFKIYGYQGADEFEYLSSMTTTPNTGALYNLAFDKNGNVSSITGSGIAAGQIITPTMSAVSSSAVTSEMVFTLLDSTGTELYSYTLADEPVVYVRDYTKTNSVYEYQVSYNVALKNLTNVDAVTLYDTNTVGADHIYDIVVVNLNH